MRFSVLIAGAFATMAVAQSKTASLSAAQQSAADCLDACKPGDVNCQSHCISVPSPNEKQIEATTKCVANCDQGKGSASDTEKYAACRDACIADNYWKSVEGSPQETATADAKDSASSAAKSAAASATDSASDEENTNTATATASESDSSATDASETESESASGSASESAAAASETGNAANALVGGVSFLGLVAAVLAL
ncbi:hypothetical protein FSARC_4657 [Fusarium sarcochroum]|uniref:HFB protein n=1 Tax=Fusarium sarcochroum TaxID=1208366 RepID=A0A8H4U151_9HYPO|nr:hypothetical protein FSARC_4657 [Fusarium sarcochroum]